ncbi:MAG: TetR/AcrR family transcriptional regulator, partial [Gaiellales bacterium]
MRPLWYKCTVHMYHIDSTTGRRQAILEATLRVIRDSGVHAVTLRAVAAEAGVPLAATTYYFESKD